MTNSVLSLGHHYLTNIYNCLSTIEFINYYYNHYTFHIIMYICIYSLAKIIAYFSV